MKNITVYIDHNPNGEEVEFAKKLRRRIEGIKGLISVSSYKDIEPKRNNEGDNDWEKVTLQAVKNADIIIPIITSDYLAHSVPDDMNSEFIDIINSTGRYLFPIIFSESDWSSYSWMVKSKLLPLDADTISELTEQGLEKELNQIFRTIENIYIKSNGNEDFEVAQNSDAKKSVFISHDHDDADFAELLKLRLEKDGIKAWIDTERLKIGQDWREEIDLGIENSIALIAVMTPESRQSEYVTYEWAFAWGKCVKIFPIMLKQTQLHPRLESLQYLDFTNRSARPWDELLNSIKSLE